MKGDWYWLSEITKLIFRLLLIQRGARKNLIALTVYCYYRFDAEGLKSGGLHLRTHYQRGLRSSLILVGARERVSYGDARPG
jgi:hypothetical protein